MRASVDGHLVSQYFEDGARSRFAACASEQYRFRRKLRQTVRIDQQLSRRACPSAGTDADTAAGDVERGAPTARRRANQGTSERQPRRRRERDEPTVVRHPRFTNVGRIGLRTKKIVRRCELVLCPPLHDFAGLEEETLRARGSVVRAGGRERSGYELAAVRPNASFA